MKKVLFVATVDSHIELFHLPYLKMFHDKGWEVHVATDTGKKIKYCDKKIKLPIKRSPFKLVSNYKAMRKLREVMKKEGYSIVHCHTPMGGVAARMAGRKLRRQGQRMIYTAHGFHFYTGAPVHYWLMFYPVEWYLAKFTDTLITINNEDYERAKKRFGKRCRDIQYVPGVGVDPKKFEKKLSTKEKHALRESLGLKDDDKVLIFPAEISKRKNQTWLIKALEPLFKKDERYHLLLPGKDSLNGKCQRLVEELGLEKQVHFLGFRGDVLELLQISDVAVSSAKQEGLPVNLIEAAMVGLPIVATDCRGNRDVCKKVDGVIIKQGDVDALLKSFFEIQNCVVEKRGIDYSLEYVRARMKTVYSIDMPIKERIAVITSGFLPVPSTKGGASEELVEAFIDENEIKRKVYVTVLSTYDKDASSLASTYRESDFVFLKPYKISKFIDNFNYFIIDKILRCPNSRKYRFFLQRFDFFYKCSKFLKKVDFDKIILENHTLLFFVMKWNKNYIKYDGRYYYHCHNIVPSKYGLERIINKTRGVISVSNFRNEYAKRFFAKDASDCCVVLNCCNKVVCRTVDKKEVASLKRKYSLENKKVILFVGRIDRDKGIKELIDAFNSLKNDEYALLIVGSPMFAIKSSNSYEKMISREIRNNPNIRVTGYVDHKELYKYYSLCDLVAVPSQIEDSAPLVVIEALSCGKPIVATKCGGIPEYVDDECAVLVNKGRNYVNDLSRSICRILNDDESRERMALASKRRSKMYSTELYYDNLLKALGVV